MFKATYHCSRRKGNANHNDRNFDVSKAENIDETKTKNNHTAHIYTLTKFKNLTFEEAEKKAYEYFFSKSLEAKNERYRKQRHSERCKTIDDLLHDKNTKPEEVWVQIGNYDNKFEDKKKFFAILKDFSGLTEKWNKKHGNIICDLDMSIHVDESSLHLHTRRIFLAKDKEGNFEPCMNKALKQARVRLPKRHEKEGRYNNRKMTLDKTFRRLFIIACEKNGVEIDKVPSITSKSKSMNNQEKDDYIKNKIENKVKEATKEREKELDIREENLNKKEKAVIEILDNVTTLSKHKNNIKSVFKKAINSKSRDERNYYISKSSSIVEAITETIDKATETAINANIINSNDSMGIDKDWNLMTIFEKEELARKEMLKEI